jgi:hypothetical protein
MRCDFDTIISEDGRCKFGRPGSTKEGHPSVIWDQYYREMVILMKMLIKSGVDETASSIESPMRQESVMEVERQVLQDND